MKLAAGDWALLAAPERGGAILALTRAGHDILRPTAETATDPTDLAWFPLVPYANRIANGAFTWQGRNVALPRNHAHNPHPLHGLGWVRAWQVTRADRHALAMRFDHGGDEHWPWAFTSEQQLSLTPEGLTATLSLRNEAAAAMPFSLGFHPYFMRSQRMTFEADGLWLIDSDVLPTRHVPADALGDWSRGGALERPDPVDHCYTGWRGTATIARADGDVAISARGTGALHLYLPPMQTFFCVEPVTAMPNAVNHGQAATLHPGEQAQIVMTVHNA